MKRTHLLIGVGSIATLAVAYALSRSEPEPTAGASGPPEGKALVSITMPPIEGNAAIGQGIFENACAECHGTNGVGVDGAGPPLIHKIYEPGHHADEAFQRAVAHGVRGHHWSFGDMPAREGLTRGDVAMVIAYIREIQRANGIQ